MTPEWLRELYRQWVIARGKQIGPRSRAFRRKWQALLDAAGLHSAEDQKVAVREADREESKGNVKLHRMRGRKYIILQIELPLEAESWLLALFNQRLPAELLKTSLLDIAKA